jgi:hypothetical protein
MHGSGLPGISRQYNLNLQHRRSLPGWQTQRVWKLHVTELSCAGPIGEVRRAVGCTLQDVLGSGMLPGA